MGIINSAIYEAKELLENYENVEVDKNTYDNVLKPYLQENGFEFEASGIDANTVHVEIETSNLSNSQYNTIDSIVSSIYDESLNEDNVETNNDQIASMIKEKVKKLFDQESDKSDKSGSIDDDGFGFRIVRANGKTLTYSANDGFLYESLDKKSLNETFENTFDKLMSFEVK